MKHTKFLFLLFFVFVLASCAKDSPNATDLTNENSFEVDSRSNCNVRLIGQLNHFTKVANGVSNGSQNAAGVAQSWSNLTGIVNDCLPGDLTSTITHYDTWSCDNIGVDGIDQNAGAPCPLSLEIAFARADCYLQEWVNSNAEDDLAASAFVGAYCDFLLMVNICLDLGINATAYCTLLNL